GLGGGGDVGTVFLLRGGGAAAVRVRRRGEAPAMTGLLSGDVNFVVATSTLAVPHLRSGEVRGIAITGKTRWKDFPEIPTIAESGLPEFEVISWSGIAAPANTPKAIVDRLHAEIQRAIAVPDVHGRLESFGAEVRGTTPAEMRALVEHQLALWTKVARQSSIQLD